MNTQELYAEMKSSLDYDLFELVDDYDADGSRITIYKDETTPGWYLVNVETTTPGNFRYSGAGMKSKSELIDMSLDDFERMVNAINYYAQLVD